jgi:hypothetical protein
MVEVTQGNAREAAAAAQRLLNDPYLAETLDEMVVAATERAITNPDRQARREARHEALAIARLRVNLQTVAERWREAARVLEAARKHE